MSESQKPGVPAAPIAPGNFDRAWNDPPLFSYSESSTQQAQSSGLKLNKRVGFPASQPPPPPTATGDTSGGPPRLHDAGCKPLPSSILPPPPPGGLAPPPTGSQSGADQGDDTAASGAETENRKNVDKSDICDKLKEFASQYCGAKAGDICKRISLLEKGWDSLSTRIGLILADFCGFLEAGNLTEADKRLTTLGADHAGECSLWIIGLRHILTGAKAQKPTKDDASSSVTSPYFVPQPSSN